MSNRPAEILSAIDRRLWRDLGFADPEPEILRFLPMLVVAWSDGRVGTPETNTIRDRARELPSHLRAWLDERLKHPPGPYFRFQVTHLLAFMCSTWSDQERDGCRDWTETGSRWADELIQDQGWFRRVIGGVAREQADLATLNAAMGEHGIYVSDRIWALARGAHAEAEPRRVVFCHADGDQVNQAVGIAFEGDEEHLAVGTMQALARDEDLDQKHVAALLGRSKHLRENERWILLGEQFFRAARPLTPIQRETLELAMTRSCGCGFEECSFAELAYLEDALSIDARWTSWVAGQVEELHIDRDEVVRPQIPGTFYAPRAKVKATVEQKLVAGPPGLGFRVLDLVAGGEGDARGAHLRLATPVITQEPATPECVQWIARFLPAMVDPWTQLVLDEDGPRWVAEVLPEMATRPATSFEALLPGRSLLVPPWVWFRAAEALGVRFFTGKRKQTS
ncbi:MAG: hypothetical protein FJ102_15205 [Deltaproteobacteria bacterium]|nr:hypothetical protein [Deltaproteobacteria bacterium]